MFGIKKKNEAILLGDLIEGMELEENTDIFLKLNEKELYMFGLVNGKKYEFNLNIDDVTSIVHKSEIEMQQYVKQSIPGMIIGNATFGLLGAIIGGRVKTKEKKQITDFIIINYYDNETLKTIVLTTCDPNKLKFIDFYNAL